jgi:hypothetical protein
MATTATAPITICVVVASWYFEYCPTRNSVTNTPMRAQSTLRAEYRSRYGPTKPERPNSPGGSFEWWRGHRREGLDAKCIHEQRLVFDRLGRFPRPFARPHPLARRLSATIALSVASTIGTDATSRTRPLRCLYGLTFTMPLADGNSVVLRGPT